MSPARPRRTPTGGSASAGKPVLEQARFDALAAELVDPPVVTRGKMFGCPGLRVGTKFFAALFEGNLIVKLPRERVYELVGAGAGQPFEPMPGRVMGGWLMLPPGPAESWLGLAREAQAFLMAAAT